MTVVSARLTALALAFALAACASTGAKEAKSNPAVKFDRNPYPSTYKPYPGAPTALVRATVFDGAEIGRAHV